MNALRAAMVNKRRKAMAKSHDDTSAGAVLAGFLSALSDPAKAAEQMASFQATLADIDARRAALQQEQTALDVRSASVKQAEAELAVIADDTKAAAAAAEARLAAAAAAEGKLQRREDELKDGVAQLRADRKDFKDAQAVIEGRRAQEIADLKKWRDELIAREAAVDGAETVLAAREEKLAKAEADFEARADALRKAING